MTTIWGTLNGLVAPPSAQWMSRRPLIGRLMFCEPPTLERPGYVQEARSPGINPSLPGLSFWICKNKGRGGWTRSPSSPPVPGTRICMHPCSRVRVAGSLHQAQDLHTSTHHSPAWNLRPFRWRLAHRVRLAHFPPV